MRVSHAKRAKRCDQSQICSTGMMRNRQKLMLSGATVRRFNGGQPYASLRSKDLSSCRCHAKGRTALALGRAYRLGYDAQRPLWARSRNLKRMKTAVGIACLVAACVQFWFAIKMFRTRKIADVAERGAKIAVLDRISRVIQVASLSIYGTFIFMKLTH